MFSIILNTVFIRIIPDEVTDGCVAFSLVGLVGGVTGGSAGGVGGVTGGVGGVSGVSSCAPHRYHHIHNFVLPSVVVAVAVARFV